MSKYKVGYLLPDNTRVTAPAPATWTVHMCTSGFWVDADGDIDTAYDDRVMYIPEGRILCVTIDGATEQ